MLIVLRIFLHGWSFYNAREVREERRSKKREETMKTVVKRLEFIVIAAPSLISSLKCDEIKKVSERHTKRCIIKSISHQK